jgi:c-di-GMP-binding flagellar brake protein YcgR
MGHKRIYVRVPLSGEAVLSNSGKPTIKARTIDISQGGVAITAFSDEVSSAEYRIDILTEAGQRIEIFAQLVRVDEGIAGFKTLQIDEKCQEIIKNLVFEYQETPDFIKQLDEYNLLDDKVVDEDGNEIEVTFENDSNSV